MQGVRAPPPHPSSSSSPPPHPNPPLRHSSVAKFLARVFARRRQVAEADFKVGRAPLAGRRERPVARRAESHLARFPARVLLIRQVVHAPRLAVLDPRELRAHVDARVFLSCVCARAAGGRKEQRAGVFGEGWGSGGTAGVSVRRD